jgi:hypothetical protein
VTAALITRLHDLAGEPVPGPDPAFVAALEERLRAAAAGSRFLTYGEPDPSNPGLADPGLADPGLADPRLADPSDRTDRLDPGRTGPQPPEPRQRGRLIRRRVLQAGLATAAVAAALAALVLSARPAHPRVQLAGAIDTQVIGPDGRVGEAAPGAVIADGSIIRTGPAGQIRAGGVVIGPNRDALAVDGRLRAVSSDAVRDRREAAGPDAGSRPGTDLHLTVHRSGNSDQLRWARFAGRDLYGYVILRADGGGVPDTNQDAVAFTTGTSVMARSSGMVTYRVVAVDRQGRVLAFSDSVTVGPG